MIDPSPLYLFTLEEVDDRPVLGEACADSPVARRLAVLLGEAAEAGQHERITATFRAWIDAMLGWSAATSKWPAAIKMEVERLLEVGHRLGPSSDVPAEIQDATDALAGQDAEREAVRWYMMWRFNDEGARSYVLNAWEHATRILGCVEEVTGKGAGAEAAIERCAQLAYARLWPKQSAEVRS